MSETVRTSIHNEMIERGDLLRGETLVTHGNSFALATIHLLDYPIVRCGDSKAVLAVDREELAEAYEDGARKAVDTGNHMAGPLAGVDALLAKLDLREVERIIPIKHGKKMWGAGPLPGGYCEVALLKPSPTSKEG